MAKSKPKVVNPQGVFNHASAFYGALDQLHRTSTQERFLQIAGPMMVLTAFSCELLFKCLIAIEKNGETVPSHLLLDLFDLISPDVQARIEQHWDGIQAQRKEMLDAIEKKEGKPIARDIRSNLKEANDLFRQVRYFYESPPAFGFYIGDLPIALHRTICDLKPEWISPPIVDQPHPVLVKGKDNAASNFPALSARYVINGKPTSL